MISNKKLLEVYNLTQKDFFKHKNQKSILWQKFHSNKKFDDENNLINFRKKQVLSEGLDDAMNLQNKLNLIETLKFFDSEFLKKNLPTKNIGNSNFSRNFLGFYFDHGIIHHLKWFEEISKIIFKKSKVICEIGGGFGNLARIIINNHETKYILIDLPETNLLSSFYLKEHFPKKKFYLYDNYLEDPLLKNLDNFDIYILPPWCEFEKSLKIDCFINARSMQEMNMNIIKKYFDLIHAHISSGGFFLNINRYEKSVVGEGEKICIHEYPYDSNWDVIISKPSFLQPRVHFLLTQRKVENFKNNIKDELNKIGIINDNIKRNYNKNLIIIKNYFKEKIYKIIKKVLLFFFVKEKLKKIARILYNMTTS